MKRRALVCALMLCLCAVRASADDLYILNISGNNFSTEEPQAIGEELEIVAQLSQVQPDTPFSLPGIGDWSTEYTVVVFGLTLQSDPSAFVRNFAGGTIEIWAQSPGNAPWTPTTAVGSIPALDSQVVPSTFLDGDLVLRGQFSSFAVLDFTQLGSSSGTITGTDITWTSGANLADLQGLGIASNWVWNGFFDVSAAVPSGYQIAYGGKLERSVPTSVEPVTWGYIKDLWSE